MNATNKLVWLAALAAALAAGTASAETVRVTADRVNMRAKPGFENSEVLGQVAYDQRLDRIRDEGEWVGVAPPESVSFWVNGDYVRKPDHVVTASRVNVRAGPSVNYTVLGTVERGATVQVRRELDGWLEIAAPEGTCVWIYREYVESPESGATGAAPAQTASLPKPPPPEPRAREREAAPAPAFPAAPPPKVAPVDTAVPPPAKPAEPVASVLPAPLPLPVATTTNTAALASPSPRARNRNYTRADADLPVTPVPVPSVEMKPPVAAGSGPATPIVSPSRPDAAAGEATGLPAKLKLVPLDGQGRQAVYEGKLRAAPLLNDGPTRYRVLVWQDNRWQILCHVVGEAVKFRALQDKSVRVRGKEYWVQNVAAPVLVPEQIQEIVAEENK